MTQRGLGPASQRGGETARLEGQAGVADGIDAAVDAVQPPGPHPCRDRAVAHSQLGELRSGHEPPLPSGQLGQLNVAHAVHRRGDRAGHPAHLPDPLDDDDGGGIARRGVPPRPDHRARSPRELRAARSRAALRARRARPRPAHGGHGLRLARRPRAGGARRSRALAARGAAARAEHRGARGARLLLVSRLPWPARVLPADRRARVVRHRGQLPQCRARAAHPARDPLLPPRPGRSAPALVRPARHGQDLRATRPGLGVAAVVLHALRR